ncbi:MAG: hypothetical protein HS116_18005 [Planctomycetes bacterium]|nr:hypothetical protein [Planctomycetota bacterium]
MSDEKGGNHHLRGPQVYIFVLGNLLTYLVAFMSRYGQNAVAGTVMLCSAMYGATLVATWILQEDLSLRYSLRELVILLLSLSILVGILTVNYSLDQQARARAGLTPPDTKGAP